MALRLSSNLMLGVTNIVTRKCHFILQETTDAYNHIKAMLRPTKGSRTNRPGRVDLPDPSNPKPTSITLAEPNFHELSAPLVDLNTIPGAKRRAGGSAYLADDRDITMDQYASGLAGGIMSVSADVDIDREADAGLVEPSEPLLFTPSHRSNEQLNIPQSVGPLSDSNRGPSLSSVEIPRVVDAGSRAPSQAPAFSFERNVDVPMATNDEPDLVLADDTPSRLGDLGPEMADTPGITPNVPGNTFDDVPPIEDSQSDAGQFTMREDEVVPALGPMSSGAGNQANSDSAREVEGLRLSRNSPGFSLRPSDVASATREEQEAEAETAAEAAAIPEKVRRPKKRRAEKMIMDEVTEMGVDELRESLNDTAHLVLRDGERRNPPARKIRRKARRYEEMIAQPVLAMAPELALWYADLQGSVLRKPPGSPMSSEASGRNREGQTRTEGEHDSEEKLEGNVAEAGGTNPPVAEVLPIEQVDEVTVREEQATENKESGAKEISVDPYAFPRFDQGDEEHFVRSPSFNHDVEDAGSIMGEVGPVEAGTFMASQGAEFDGENISNEVEVDDGIEREEIQEGEDEITLAQVARASSAVEGTEKVTASTVSVRTLLMARWIKNHTEENESLEFIGELEKERANNRTKARTFYELLSLCNKGGINMQQEQAFGKISVTTESPMFEQFIEQADKNNVPS